jgi:hypothetical protein
MLVHTTQICKYQEMGQHDPLLEYKGMLSLRSCLADARMVLFITAEQVFLLMGEVWLMHNADTNTQWREREGQRTKNILCSNLSCLAIQ